MMASSRRGAEPLPPCAQDPSLRLKNGSGQDDTQANFAAGYSTAFAPPNKIIRIEMLPKSNPSYG